MIIRHCRSSLFHYRIALKSSHPHHNTKLLPGIRLFHVSKPNLIVDEALQLSSALFYFVHDTSGLSWGLSIPLTTAISQLAFTPLHYVIERNKHLQTQGAILIPAYRAAFQHQARTQKTRTLTEADAILAEAEVKRKLKAKSKQIQAALGYMGNWLNFTALSYIPVWVANIGALRRMCGFTADNSNLIEASSLNGIAVDPALTTEGLLWFTDLTVADPLFLLPMISGGFYLTSVLTIGRNSTGKPTRLQSVILTIAALSGPLYVAIGISNAVALAMIGSTIVTLVRRPILDRIVGQTSMVKQLDPRPRTAVLKKELGIGK